MLIQNAFTVRVVVSVPTYLLSYLASKIHHHISITIKKAELLLYGSYSRLYCQGSLKKCIPLNSALPQYCHTLLLLGESISLTNHSTRTRWSESSLSLTTTIDAKTPQPIRCTVSKEWTKDAQVLGERKEVCHASKPRAKTM